MQKIFASGTPDLPTQEATFWTSWQSLILFLKSLVDPVQKENDSGLNEVFAGFVSKAIKSVSTRFVSSRPTEPRDWSRPNAQTIMCQCGPCQEIKQFLINPVHQAATFSYAERVRRHIQNSLKSNFRFETNRKTNPHTLIVYKTTNEYKNSLQ